MILQHGVSFLNVAVMERFSSASAKRTEFPRSRANVNHMLRMVLLGGERVDIRYSQLPPHL